MGSSSMQGFDMRRSPADMGRRDSARDFGRSDRMLSPDTGTLGGRGGLVDLTSRDFGVGPSISRTGMSSRDSFDARQRAPPVPAFNQGLPSPPPAPRMTNRRHGMTSSLAGANRQRSIDPNVDFQSAVSFGTTGRLPPVRPSAELSRQAGARRPPIGSADMRRAAGAGAMGGARACGGMSMPAGPCIMFPYPRCGPGYRYVRLKSSNSFDTVLLTLAETYNTKASH